MFIAKKIITSKQMKTYRAKNSSVMKDLLAKGGGEIIRKKVLQREIWGALREDSKSHEFGERGYTKKGLTTFMGKLLADKKEQLTKYKITDRKVRQLAGLFGIKKGKLFNAAAEARMEQREVKAQERQAESQVHQQKDVESRNHISEIVSRARENARGGLHDSSPSSINHGQAGHTDLMHAEENYSNRNVLASFERSNANIRNIQSGPVNLNEYRAGKNNSQAFGHVRFRNNSEHDYAEDEKNKKSKAEELKARLATIQGRGDNEESSEEKLAA